MKSIDVALAVVPPALWAITYTIAKPATEAFPPLLLTCLAYSLTAVFLLRPRQKMATPYWVLLAVGTLGCGLQSALIFSGIALVPASMAILAVQTQVPFAVLAGWVIGQEKLNPLRSGGIAVALAGVALVVGIPQAFGDRQGLILIVLGTISWGIAQGLIRTFACDTGWRLMGAMSAVAAPQLLLASLFLETGQVSALADARLIDWAALLALTLGGFVAAYAIWYGLLQRYRVDQITPFALLMPIIGVVSAAMLLGERPSLAALSGGAITFAGLLLIVWVPRDKAGTRDRPTAGSSASPD